ncbi:hypothetical protein P5673_011878 [Acropora cervicornis]|uniref:Uncharacterized protein n=1 Tax=Acropora cervicornis TaxID=6130 RepID=A0AAD9QND4_ACRCE|nr:hypothetical protein P5673_011878 [Acropora cervicornis]
MENLNGAAGRLLLASNDPVSFDGFSIQCQQECSVLKITCLPSRKYSNFSKPYRTPKYSRSALDSALVSDRHAMDTALSFCVSLFIWARLLHVLGLPHTSTVELRDAVIQDISTSQTSQNAYGLMFLELEGGNHVAYSIKEFVNLPSLFLYLKQPLDLNWNRGGSLVGNC